MSTNDPQWAAWCEVFDLAEAGVRRVFHERYVFLTINQMLDQSGQDIGLNQYVQSYLVSGYVGSLSSGVRRECDKDTRTSSLYRCLEKLAKNPAIANRARFEAAVDTNPSTPHQYRANVKRGFDDFAASSQSPDLDVDRVLKDLDDLRMTADTVVVYTNKVVAHRDIVTTDTPTWIELDTALNKVGEMLKRYYILRNPGTVLGNLAPDLPGGWEEPFDTPGVPPASGPPEPGDFDDYIYAGPVTS